MQVHKLNPKATFDRQFAHDAGFDLTCVDISYKDDGRICLHLGIATAPPQDFYFTLVPRSSFSKSSFVMANSIGIIDEGYRGEWMMMIRPMPNVWEQLQVQVMSGFEPEEVKEGLINYCKELFLNQRVAQAILHRNESRYYEPKFVDSLDKSERGKGAFGSTGS